MHAAVSQPSHLWLGPEYRSGQREGGLLIVAERLPEDAPRFRVGLGLEAMLTGGYLDGSAKNRQFTDLARAVLGTAAPREACEAFFRQVAFANLPAESTGALRPNSRGAQAAPAQSPVAPPPQLQTQPPEQSWRQACGWLRDLVSELVPARVLLVGGRAAQQLARQLVEVEAISGLQVCCMPHPGGRGFDFRTAAEGLAPLRCALGAQGQA